MVISWTGFHRVGGFCSMTYFLPSPGQRAAVFILSSSSLESNISMDTKPSSISMLGAMGQDGGMEAVSLGASWVRVCRTVLQLSLL